ncbi:MAG: protein kinase [Desulfobacterales bacterium]|nr:protein kinase [Desulfobacterales bacterium]
MVETPHNVLFSTGSVIDGKWILMERIGKGGMGEVYRAHQLNLKRDVAIKIISKEMMEAFQDDPTEAERAFKRLQREVQTMAQVRHPNALQIFDFGEIEVQGQSGSTPVQYIVMEYVPGNTLRFTMSEDGFGEDPASVQKWLRQYFFPVLDGIEAVHGNEIVHRDIKPENVLMDGDIPKIADFGLARSPRMGAISNSWDVKGTMHYMAPEQFIDFRKVGPAVDIYALGKILYEAVEGKIGPGVVPLKQVGLTNPERLFSKKIDDIVRKATAENPGDRYQTIAEMRAALTDAIHLSEKAAKPGGRGRGPRLVLALSVLAILSVLAMTAWHLAGNPNGGRAPVAQEAFQAGSEAPPPEIHGRDGKEMVLIEERLSTEPSGQPFYMDREKVSYYDFVQFLNEAKDRLTVHEGIVESGNGDIWYYLGTGSEPYGQIFYEHDRFHLRDQDNADLPVRRVSFFGARAYAGHYGKRIPTTAQWARAVSWVEARLPEAAFNPDPPLDASAESASGHMHMMDMNPAEDQVGTGDAGTGSDMDLPLDDPAMHLREWSMDGTENRPLVVSWASMTGAGEPTAPYRSEGFADVGFRTVMNLSDISMEMIKGDKK